MVVWGVEEFIAHLWLCRVRNSVLLVSNNKEERGKRVVIVKI